MFAVMPLQKVRRLRVLKILWLEGFWIQRNVPPLTSHSTKANAKKPVRYTSIKKAQPKSISDVAKLLQQKSKETKERQQSLMSTATLTAATNPAKPASPNPPSNQSDAAATIISTAKPQTSAINFPAQDSSESATHLDSKPIQDIADAEAAANFTDFSQSEAYKMPVESRTACENAPHTENAVGFAYSKHAVQMTMERLHNEMYTDARDSEAKSVDSGVELTSINVPQEASTGVTTNISQTPQTPELISSYYDVASVSEKCSPEVVVRDETVYMPEVIKTSKIIATPEMSSVPMNSHQESLAFSEFVTVTNASDIINITQSQPTQSQDVQASKWSNIRTTSSQVIINQFFPNATPDCSRDISNAEAATLAAGGDPAFPQVCHEEAIPSPVPEISFLQSAKDLPISVSPSDAVKVDAVSEMSGEAQSSIKLKDPILAQNDILEEKKPTETVEKLPEAQLDPIQRLFLDKIREYFTKSQASGGLVDAGPEYEKVLSEERTKLQRLYGGGDLTEFPEFNFSEPLLDERNSK